MFQATRKAWLIPAILALLGAGGVSEATPQSFSIVIAYDKQFPENLRPAVEYAAQRWAGWITNTASGGASTLELSLGWSPLGSGVLGQAGASWIGHDGNLALTPAQYMIRTGQDLYGSDGTITLSSKQSWYGGTDGAIPAGQYDLVSVMLHEIGHQLGMYDSYMEVSGTWGWGFRDGLFGPYHLTLWDTYLRDQDGDAPVARPGPEYFDETGTVTFTGPAAMAANAGLPVGVYAPDPFQSGSSLSHVDQPGDADAMMYYAIASGTAKQGLYDYERGVFTDLGWTFITPADVHAVGKGTRDWHYGGAWTGGLPPVGSTAVYLDAAVASSYTVAVEKDSSAAAVTLTGPARLRLRGGTLTVARDVRSDANLDVDPDGAGGSLAADRLDVGFAGTGRLTQYGGTVTVAGLYVGDRVGSVGTYALLGGSLAAGSVSIGQDGSGTLNIAGPAADMRISSLLRFGPGAVLTAGSGATIRLSGSAMENLSTVPGNLALANVTLVLEGGPGVTTAFEAAGRDLGAVLAGWSGNFALARLELGGMDAGRMSLVNQFDNTPSWAGLEALYVTDLVLGPGAAVELNGLNLYYLNGGPPKRLLLGDTDLDGGVGFPDYQALEVQFGLPGTWATGDFDGDGQVTFLDYQLLESQFGLQSVPEPGALALLSAGLWLVATRCRQA